LPPQSDGRKGEASREVAEFYFAQRNYTAAESRFREALQFNPADAKAMFELAQTSEKLNRKDEALQEYRSCIEFDPRGAYAEKARRAIQRVGLHAASQGRSSRS
jgi:Flp pilus assembly protein TadD